MKNQWGIGAISNPMLEQIELFWLCDAKLYVRAL
jgi:hypothetical protein